MLEAQGTFDELMVWGHEILPAADDTFVKGVEEWVRFAETVGAHSNTMMIPRLTLLVDAWDSYARDRGEMKDKIWSDSFDL